MKYRTLGKTGIKASILGFGAMRLPLKSQNPEDVDKEETQKMIDYAVENGINMFDTALLYHTSAGYTRRFSPGKISPASEIAVSALAQSAGAVV